MGSGGAEACRAGGPASPAELGPSVLRRVDAVPAGGYRSVMSEHRVDVAWERRGGPFEYESFDRTHRWSFPGGPALEASSAPEYKGRADLPNPEQALAVALSSCHMLTFLSLAARKRIAVERYRDEASAFLGKDADGRLAVTRVVLRPRVDFADGPPAPEVLARLHEQAHEHCFIASSVRCEVVVEPRD